MSVVVGSAGVVANAATTSGTGARFFRVLAASCYQGVRILVMWCFL